MEYICNSFIKKAQDLIDDEGYAGDIIAYEYDHVDIMRQSKIVRNAGNFDRSGWTEKSIKLDKKKSFIDYIQKVK